MNKVEFLQNSNGYRYSIDSFILADFVASSEKSKIIDLGTGNGIIPLLLASGTSSKIIGLEIQSSLLKHARLNIVRNKLEKQITLIRGDIRFSKLFFKSNSFDILVSNPPYRALKRGRLNPNLEKAIARHEVLITLPELVENGVCLLRDFGKLFMIYLPERYNELINIMNQKGLTPEKVRFVHSYEKSAPKMFLIEAVKKGKGKTQCLDPLYIYDMNGNYTSEMKKIYDSFDNHSWPNGCRKIRKSSSSGKTA